MTDQFNPVPPQYPQQPNANQARTWHMWCHLSALAGFVVPFGNIIGPLIIWQTKKNELPSLDAHGKAAVNFQLTVSIATLAAALAAIPLSFVCIGYLLIPVAVAIAICGMIFAVIAGIKANDGQEYRYPYSFSLV
jgi:uncharacterized Tic20 family protein